jgi:D-tyrosyl-tRNA(Tyr) deacylase
MRAVVQRVSESSVAVGPEVVGRIGRGLLVLLGVSKTDTEKESAALAEKIVHLRVFEDEGGRLNRSFIVAEKCWSSPNSPCSPTVARLPPSFTEAAEPELATRPYSSFARRQANLQCGPAAWWPSWRPCERRPGIFIIDRCNFC